MHTQLQVTLDFLHLEDALFFAEQSISGGANALELGELLIKNTGLNGVRTFRDRFPDIPLIVDLKTISDNGEIEAFAEVGANGITISGAISELNWEKCLQAAKKRSLQLFFDMRGSLHSFLLRRSDLIKDASYIVIDFQEIDSSLILLEEITSYLSTPVAVHGIYEEEHVVQSISSGASRIILPFRDEKCQNIREKVSQLRGILDRAPENPMEFPEYHEKSLRSKLGQLGPSQICEVYPGPVYLEKVYPLHRFTKIIGKASTLKVWPGSQMAVSKFLAETREGSIVVVDSGNGGQAVWDALATEIAMKQKLVGGVVYGSITDVNVIRGKCFPCYVSSITAVRGKEKCGALKNVPLYLGDVLVNPGDWMIGDDSGIICIPAQKAFSIADKALRLLQYKAKLMQKMENLQGEEMEKAIVQYYTAHERFRAE